MANNVDADLYDDIIKKRMDEVVGHCEKLEDGPFHTITIHEDTVLHVALYSMQVDLTMALLNLIDRYPEKDWANKMMKKNKAGSTILHEAATSDKFVEAAKIMLSKAPQLLQEDNQYQEKAIFRAAPYGQSKMFKFLDENISKSLNPSGQAIAADHQKDFYASYHQRKDKNNMIIGTILHAAVEAEEFELAFWIANKYKYLVDLEDMEGKTPLQILASKTWTFRSWSVDTSLKRFFSSRVSTEEGESWCRLPWWEKLQNKRRKYESAMKLVKFLVENDISWKNTSPLDQEQEQPASNVMLEEEKMGQRKPKTPLFLAAESGVVEIVEEILKKHPQAVEHIDDKGRTILHIAIKNLQLEILDIVAKMEIPMKRLIRKVDNRMNSILHMIGANEVDPLAETAAETAKKSPALELQDDLLLFERIDEMCSEYFLKHRNKEGKTAEELFASNNEKRREVAQEWLKRTAENCTIVAVLIATVAFAAAYTVPGGSNQNTGVPLLLDQPFFVIFTIADVLSLTFTLTSVIVFLSILTSPFRLSEFKQSLPQRLMLGVSFLIFSVSMMMLAFAATVILMIRNKQQWTKIALYTVAFLPVSVFAVSYMPLYLSLVETFKYTVRQLVSIFPRFNFARLVKYSFCKSKATLALSHSNATIQGTGASASSSPV